MNDNNLPSDYEPDEDEAMGERGHSNFYEVVERRGSGDASEES